MIKKNLDRLTEIYRNSKPDETALFLGSGVNGGAWAREHPACASWPALLREAGGRFHQPETLDKLLQSGAQNWIEVADRVFAGQDRIRIAQAIDQTLYVDILREPSSRSNRPKKHKILPWKVLKHMDTLRAAVAFSAAIHDPAKTRSMRRNPKVGRILTTNYDFFFGAAWPRYTSMSNSWWPVTRSSKRVLSQGVGPIIYLHGYLPYDGKGEKDTVLTPDNYQHAYSEIGFAKKKLTETVAHCNLIFIGFSFSDDGICDLIRLHGSSNTHFALLHQDEKEAIRAAQAADVRPILLESWSELPDLLSTVYQAGLDQTELECTKMPAAKYWEKLQQGLQPR